MEAYKQCLEQLPEINRATLKQLVLHLSRFVLFIYRRTYLIVVVLVLELLGTADLDLGI